MMVYLASLRHTVGVCASVSWQYSELGCLYAVAPQQRGQSASLTVNGGTPDTSPLRVNRSYQ